MHLNLLQDIPALFVYSNRDVVVKEENVMELYNTYRGNKRLTMISSMHHQDRPGNMI